MVHLREYPVLRNAGFGGPGDALAPSGNGRDDLAERRSQRTQDESVIHALVVDAP